MLDKIKLKLIDDKYLDNNGYISNDYKFKLNFPEFNIKDSIIIGKPEEKFETKLFLPIGEGRKGEGGLRTKGYFKFSYKYVNNTWMIADYYGNTLKNVPDEIDVKINEYLSSTENSEIKELPLITVITVVYNGEKYLEQTIQSVINQTYPNVEYIIIDGGSTDGTLDIIKKYEDYIDYWVSEKDKGIYDAMNKGWSLASKNSYILYLGAGDTILSFPHIKNIYNNSNSIIYGNVILGNKIFKSKHGFLLKISNTIHHQALLIPKRLNIEPPFNIKYQTYADYDFNLRLYLKKYKFLYSETFKSYAMPNGVSSKIKYFEIIDISNKNAGFIFGLLSTIYCLYHYIKIRFNL